MFALTSKHHSPFIHRKKMDEHAYKNMNFFYKSVSTQNKKNYIIK